jgi:hypothetical protein
VQAFAGTAIKSGCQQPCASFLAYGCSSYFPHVVTGEGGVGRHLLELAEKDMPAFLCHFYNTYFAHSAGGKMIGTKLSAVLLDRKKLHFYQYEGGERGDKPLLEVNPPRVAISFTTLLLGICAGKGWRGRGITCTSCFVVFCFLFFFVFFFSRAWAGGQMEGEWRIRKVHTGHGDGGTEWGEGMRGLRGSRH